MLDTVRMFTSDFDIDKKNSKIEVGQKIDYSTGEVKSEKMYCNLKNFSIDIKRDEKRLTDNLYFQTSLPKLLYKTSLFEITENDIDRSIDEIQKTLNSAGVIIDKNNLNDFKISRVDFCKNIQVDNNITDYLLYLDNFYFSRRLKTEIKKETVLYKNKSQQLTFYNKIKEILDTVKEKSILKLVENKDQNILRVESRLLKKRVVSQELKANKDFDFKFISLFNKDIVKRKLLKDIQCLVRDSQEQREFNFEENSKLLDYLKRENKRNINMKFLACRGTTEFLKDFGFNHEKVFEFYKENFSRAQAYKNMKEIYYFTNLMTEQKERDLLNEIRQKIAA
jgi:hypothetical protein